MKTDPAEEPRTEERDEAEAALLPLQRKDFTETMKGVLRASYAQKAIGQANANITYGKEAIKGTTEAQFKVDPKTKIVERIDVFPGPVIDKETIEGSYGPACPNGPPPATPCFVKKVTDDFRTYYQYSKLGLAIFFKEDGKTVHSFIFTPVAPASAKGAK